MRIGGNDYPVLLPTLRDPRLHLAGTISSLHVIGQLFLGFELSIAQILVSLGTAGMIEFGLTFWDRRVIAWPASALLTGNGVAFILRVNGTEHGDWWSLNGWYIFAGTAAISLLSKYLIRYGGRPLFNPSNFGLVLCFLVVGSQKVNPLDFWWGPMSPALAAVIIIIVFGGFAITARLGYLAMSAAFWLTFAAGIGIIAASGHCMSARWHVGAVCGRSFWWTLVTSPEILIFLFFMITDPKTTPTGRRARVVFGVLVGFTAALLVAPQQTEFATKVAVLAALVIVCASRPLLDLVLPADRSYDPGADGSASRLARGFPVASWGLAARIGLGALVVVAGTGLLVTAGIPARDPMPAAAAAAPEIDASVTEGRPEVALAPGAVPEVAIAEDVDEIVGSISPETATNMGTDLAENLVIEADALRAADADLGATATIGERLAALRQQMADGVADGPSYSFDEMTAVVVRDPTNPQAVPLTGVHAVGTVTPPGGATVPLDTTYVMVDVGGTFLISDTR